MLEMDDAQYEAFRWLFRRRLAEMDKEEIAVVKHRLLTLIDDLGIVSIYKNTPKNISEALDEIERRESGYNEYAKNLSKEDVNDILHGIAMATFNRYRKNPKAFE